MRAMILAAGRGGRMGELTAKVPKPLLRIGKYYLIEYSLNALKKAGITEVVINISYHREQIKSVLGNGSIYGVQIEYSEEIEPLETGGGIFQALPLLGKNPFLVLSADVISDYPLEKLTTHPLLQLAHLVLVDNPIFHPAGDYGLMETMVNHSAKKRYTYANIGVYHPDLFAHCMPGKFRLAELLAPAIANSRVTGEHFNGLWHNIGSARELSIAEEKLTGIPMTLEKLM